MRTEAGVGGAEADGSLMLHKLPAKRGEVAGA